MGLLFYAGALGLFYVLYHVFKLLATSSATRSISNSSTHTPAKKALSPIAAIIKRKLAIVPDLPKIVVSADKLIWNRSVLLISPESFSNFMEHLSEIGNLHLVVMIASDEEENTFLNLFASHVKSNAFQMHRVIFCETEIGKKAIIRQLDPHCYIDCNISVCQEAAKRAQSVVIIGVDSVEGPLIPFRSVDEILSV